MAVETIIVQCVNVMLGRAQIARSDALKAKTPLFAMRNKLNGKTIVVSENKAAPPVSFKRSKTSTR
jgi:hypothetical protein